MSVNERYRKKKKRETSKERIKKERERGKERHRE